MPGSLSETEAKRSEGIRARLTRALVVVRTRAFRNRTRLAIVRRAEKGCDYPLVSDSGFRQ